MSEFREGYPGEEEIGLGNAAEKGVPENVKEALAVLNDECAYINDDPETRSKYNDFKETVQEVAANDPERVEQIIDSLRRDLAGADGDPDAIYEILEAGINDLDELR